MKVNKKEFNNAIRYLKKLNKYKLSELDLSEFAKNIPEKAIKDCEFMGLNNSEFIKMKFWKCKFE